MIETLAPAAAKAAAGAISTVARGPMAKRISQKRLREAIEQGSSHRLPEAYVEALGDLNITKIKNLVDYLATSEFDSIIRRIIIACFTKDDGELTSEQKFEIEESVRMHVGLTHEHSAILTDIIIDHLTPAIEANISESHLAEMAPVQLLARNLPPLSVVTELGQRHRSVLGSIISLEPVFKFAEGMCKQVLAVRGRMPVPGANMMNTVVDFDTLYVQPITDATVGQTSLRTVYKGNPGGGKSTLVTHMALGIAKQSLSQGGSSVPFLLALRDVAEDIATRHKTLVECIEQTCASPYNLKAPVGVVEYLLISGRATVILDGLDELPDLSKRKIVVDAVHAFANLYREARVVVTSRKVGYETAPLDPGVFNSVEILGFDETSVTKYVNGWFSLQSELSEATRRDLVTSFMSSSKSIEDLRSNPLVLSLMCHLYAAERWIPNNRPELYEKCTLLLYQNWDRMRSIEGSQPFSAQVKQSVGALATWMLGLKAALSGVVRPNVIEFLTDYLHERVFESKIQAEDTANEIVDYCVGRAWVLTDVGAVGQQETFAFTHKTFLEYFAALDIWRNSPTMADLAIGLRPHIVGQINETISEICVQMSREKADGPDQLINSVLDSVQNGDVPMSSGVHFSCRSMLYTTPRPETRRRVFRMTLDLVREIPADLEHLSTLMCCDADNLSTISSEIYESAFAPVSDLEMCLAVYPWAVAGMSGSYSETIHGKYWREQCSRASVSELVEGNVEAPGVSYPPRWWRLTRFAYDAVAFHRLHIDTSDMAKPVLHRDVYAAPFCSRFFQSMIFEAALENRTVDGVKRLFVNDPETCRQIVEQLMRGRMAVQLSLRLRTAVRWMRIEPRTFNPKTLDVHVLSLLVLLAAMQSDLDYLANVYERGATLRKERWHWLLGGSLHGLELTEMNITPAVRTFLQSWLGGGLWTVRGQLSLNETGSTGAIGVAGEPRPGG